MDPRYIHVGSWNIQHFGQHDDDNDENEFAIAEHLEMAGVDVLALQEIYVTDMATFTNIHLDKALALVREHTGHDWKYKLFQNRRRDDDSQLCGIAWNDSRVKNTKGPFRIPVKRKVEVNGEDYWLWDRKPHAMKFSAGPGRTDIVVVPLHMKANTDSRSVVLRKRHEEVKSLMENLDLIRTEMESDEDIIFLGDTNCTGRSEQAIQEFIRHGFEDLNEDDIATFVRSNAPFDRIFVPAPPDRKAFRFSRQYILRSASPLSHKRFLSDHYIIKTTVKIRRDDD